MMVVVVLSTKVTIRLFPDLVAMTQSDPWPSSLRVGLVWRRTVESRDVDDYFLWRLRTLVTSERIVPYQNTGLANRRSALRTPLSDRFLDVPPPKDYHRVQTARLLSYIPLARTPAPPHPQFAGNTTSCYHPKRILDISYQLNLTPPVRRRPKNCHRE